MDKPPRLQAQKSCNFDQFTDIVMYLLNASWGEKWGTFCEAFPNGTDPNNVKLPVITYTLKEMTPGVISKSGTREIKPRHRATFTEDSDDQGPRATEVWEENNVKATKLATKFMDFMDMYTGFIKSQGVKEIILEKFDNNTESGQWRDNIVCRRFEYYLRLEHLNQIPSGVIEKVTGLVSPLVDMSDDYIKETIVFEINE